MPLLDRYFTQIIAKPDVYSIITLYIFGYFDTKEELLSILGRLSAHMQGMKEVHVRILDAKEEKIIEDIHFPIQKPSKKGPTDHECLDFSDPENTKLFINKYFDLTDSKPAFHEHYCAEFHLDGKEHNGLILAYFSSVNEFARILEEIGKKIKEEGQLSFTVDHMRPSTKKHLVSKGYKMYSDGSLFVPENRPNCLPLKDKNLVRHFALALWESEFND